MSHNPIPWPCAWNLLPVPPAAPSPTSGVTLCQALALWLSPERFPPPHGEQHTHTHTHTHTLFIHCQVLASQSQPVSFPTAAPQSGSRWAQPGPVTGHILIQQICPADESTFQFSPHTHSLPPPDQTPGPSWEYEVSRAPETSPAPLCLHGLQPLLATVPKMQVHWRYQVPPHIGVPPLPPTSSLIICPPLPSTSPTPPPRAPQILGSRPPFPPPPSSHSAAPESDPSSCDGSSSSSSSGSASAAARCLLPRCWRPESGGAGGHRAAGGGPAGGGGAGGSEPRAGQGQGPGPGSALPGLRWRCGCGTGSDGGMRELKRGGGGRREVRRKGGRGEPGGGGEQGACAAPGAGGAWGL